VSARLMSLSPKHERDGEPLPAHPYRDSAVLYGALAGVIVLFSALTGGAIAKTALIAVGFFVVATGWTWFRFRQRLKARAAAEADAASSGDAT
jgi:hypothetical protein